MPLCAQNQNIAFKAGAPGTPFCFSPGHPQEGAKKFAPGPILKLYTIYYHDKKFRNLFKICTIVVIFDTFVPDYYTFAGNVSLKCKEKFVRDRKLLEKSIKDTSCLI